MFTIELGSANTCRNDIGKVRAMIDAVAELDSGTYEVVFKMQLFESAPPNVPLRPEVFGAAHEYAAEQGYAMTASVFDQPSLDFLLHFTVPFVKIACVPKLYPLARNVPKDIPVVVSYPSPGRIAKANAHIVPLCCVRQYPAPIESYEVFLEDQLKRGISDHTVGWELWNRYQPAWFEKHFVLEHEDGNPDAGPFAVMPEELGEVL